MLWVIKRSTGLLYSKLFCNYIKEPATVQTVFQILGVSAIEGKFPNLLFTHFLMMTACHNSYVDNTYLSLCMRYLVYLMSLFK